MYTYGITAGWLLALAKDVYPDAALMRTGSSADATSDFAVREGHAACMRSDSSNDATPTKFLETAFVATASFIYIPLLAVAFK
ncbi:hypothetical protein MKX08_006378 [Trichoderma sp. CBMAI-0020]|nr:hypothetical protein MKX08_006378 [Trichoderma sp. CBMAI-0020]